MPDLTYTAAMLMHWLCTNPFLQYHLPSSLLLCYGLTASGRKHVKNGQVARLPGGVVRIQWDKKDFTYVGGQYVFICVPALSLWEWHPFSLSSHPTQDKVTLHVRVLGNWTRRLYNMASQ